MFISLTFFFVVKSGSLNLSVDPSQLSINISWSNTISYLDSYHNIYRHIELCYLSKEKITPHKILNEICIRIEKKESNYHVLENLLPYTKYNITGRLISLYDDGEWEFAMVTTGEYCKYKTISNICKFNCL